MSLQSSAFVTRRLSMGAILLSCTIVSASSSEAAVVSLDLGASGLNILGPNAGLSAGTKRDVFLNGLGGVNSSFDLRDNYSGMWGLDPSANFEISIISNAATANPTNFATGQSIGGTGNWATGGPATSFRHGPSSGVSPDFGANSFLGFRIINGSDYNYGYLEALWNSSTNTFELLSGAYESTANTAILAGAGGGGSGGGGGGGVPLPGAAGLAACGLLGVSRRRRR